jgi:hypothetical protein
MKTLELLLQNSDQGKTTPWPNTTKLRLGIKDPYFAFVASDKKGFPPGLKAVTSMMYCRESLCECVRQQLRGVSTRGIDIMKLRLLVWRRVTPTIKTLAANMTIFKNQTQAGVKIVNTIEKHYGWPLTKLYHIKPNNTWADQISVNNDFYYVEASQRWMKSPHMLSLYTLLFRIAVSEKRFEFRKRVRGMKSLKVVLSEMGNNLSHLEARYIDKHAGAWWLVLDNYRKLFSGRAMKKLYYPSDGYHFTEGINSLCDAVSSDLGLRAEFADILKKAKG